MGASSTGPADIGAIVASVHEAEGGWKRPLHESIQSGMVTGVLIFCVINLLRWYRHHDELLECLKLSPKLMQHLEILKALDEIVCGCGKIRENKKWPKFAKEHADELFTDLKTMVVDLNTKVKDLSRGKMKIPLEEGQMLSPTFFGVVPGALSFVTHCGHWNYWIEDPGVNQLYANKAAILAGHGKIIRVFIIPVDPRSGPQFPDDGIIRNQLEAKISVRAILQNEIPINSRRDVGVFFEKDGETVRFMSEWKDNEAILTFDDSEHPLRNYEYGFVKDHSRAIAGEDLEAWEAYKAYAKKRLVNSAALAAERPSPSPGSPQPESATAAPLASATTPAAP